ncbi:MAG: DUF3795 domain-containing protein [Bacteroidota bacterium]
MGRMIAYCGLVCTECEGYLATQADDVEALERLARKAREEYGQPDATADGVRCDGCPGETGRKISFCATCEIRACAIARGAANCGACHEYAVCEKIAEFFGMAPKAKEVLDEIAAGKE